MTIARLDLVNDEKEGTFHCFSRIVRRAFLCGWDAVTQRDYSHRKLWTHNRLQELAGIFTIDVCGYAVMENHLHVILRNRPDLARQASDRDIAQRWWRLFPKRRTPDFKAEAPTELELDLIQGGPARIAELRRRLCSISWFMRCLKEHLARRANAEDACTGRFWEGRFKCVALLDQAAILACTAYVDLNPIRAGLAETPETSDFTSAQDRIVAWQARQHLKKGPDPAPAESRHNVDRAAWLCPLRDTPTRRGFLSMDLEEYLTLLDWTGRKVIEGKRGAVPEHLSPILERLHVEGDHWLHSCRHFGSMFYRVAGEARKMKARALSTGRKWVKGMRASRAAFLST